MRLSAKTDYALRACAELGAGNTDRPASAEQVSARQDIPLRFLKTILPELAKAGIVESKRGRSGGWVLARPADEISIADVIRAIDGPLATVAGVQPQELSYRGSARPYKEMWVAVRWNLRQVLESVTIADMAGGSFPPGGRRGLRRRGRLGGPLTREQRARRAPTAGRCSAPRTGLGAPEQADRAPRLNRPASRRDRERCGRTDRLRRRRSRTS